MILCMFSLLFCLCTANQLNFEIDVIEKGARHIQTVQTNLYTNHVYYSTPAHHNIAESHKIQDFNEGLQITCIPSIQECHLMRFDKTKYQNAGNVTESIVHMWNNGVNTIIDENSTLIQQHVIVYGTEVINTAFLSQEMREMLQTFRYPLYRTKPIPDDAIIEKYPLKVDHTLAGRSSGVMYSRFFTCHRLVTVYGYTTETCEHIYECTSKLSCEQKHFVSDVMMECDCCPGYHTLNDPSVCQCHRYVRKT